MAKYIPRKGDFVSYFFGDQIGHEQQGRRPGLVVSNDLFNEQTGIAFLCPVTNAEPGYPFHIPIPSGGKVSGVVMVDQLKAVDCSERKPRFLEESSNVLLEGVLATLGRIMN
jgi:mRNA interferase MazF